MSASLQNSYSGSASPGFLNFLIVQLCFWASGLAWSILFLMACRLLLWSRAPSCQVDLELSVWFFQPICPRRPLDLEYTPVSGVAHTLIGLFSHPAFFMAGPRITEVSLFCAGGMIFSFQGPPSSIGLLPVWDIAPCGDNSIPETWMLF